ncbi:MAG: hypothetical protein IM638_08370 [Bacteroidetes bacterium]|nr:hypothetical protein [Bacteroidota bacterium]
MRKILLLLSAVIIHLLLPAQNTKRTKDGLAMYLSADSSLYLKSTVCLQTWVRYNQNNPGSTFFGKRQSDVFDIGIRRFRMQLFGKIAPRVFVYSQFGINNFNSLSARKSGAFFHDLVTEYEVLPNYLSIGAGLTGWSGLGRYASPSVALFLMSDAPLFEQATNDVTDQFLRKLSVYSKGKIGRIDYRFVLSKPFAIETMNGFSVSDTSLASRAYYNPAPARLQEQTYVQYQFFDKETNVTPYTTGCYLGKKKVFNIGAGMVYQPDMMRYRNSEGAVLTHPMALFAADVFLDLPLNKETGTALTVYGGYFHYDFGPGYYRNVGVFNVANGLEAGSKTVSGFGDAFPMAGTGSAVYVQSGFLLPAKFTASHGKLQLVVSVFSAKWDAFKQPVNVFEGGVNWLINGHNAKLNLNYQSRPVFALNAAGEPATGSALRKGMYYIQYQILI